MVNLSELEQTSIETVVIPSNNIFEELGRNTYDYKDLLSELIDNCIAARRDNVTLEVVIDIYVDANGKAQKFVIKDNAKGIPQDKFGAAISPAGVQSSNSLNEHGLGMKQAVAALGKLEYLATKTETEDKGRLVKEFRFGDIPTYLIDATNFPQYTGTEIKIADLKAVVVVNPHSITTTVMPDLGARYRRFLRPDNKILNLKMNLRQVDEPEGITHNWTAQEIKPIYFHPATRNNEPVILKHKLHSHNWEAELTFGYAPTSNEEYEELGLQVPNNFNPYKVTLNKQGLDIIFHDRVILFHQLAECEIVPTKHPNFNNIRGEISLIRGFSTAITKNSIISDHNLIECLNEIRLILNGKKEGPGGKIKDYFAHKRYPEELPETLLRDRLVAWLLENPIQKRLDVKSEFVIQGIEGYIDILADGEAWEMKINQASAYDVYQLFMYMDVGNINKGYLVAKDFSTGAQVARDFVLSNHNKEIILAPRDQFPVNHQLTETERAKYY